MISDKLVALKDDDYRRFHIRLLPEGMRDSVIGVRTPDIRKLAGKLFGTEEANGFINQLPHKYYEENNLHGFLIEKIANFDDCIREIERFLPYIDNWATCDSINPGVFRKNKALLLVHIKKWISSKHCYTVRFGLKMLMNYFLDDDFKEEYLDRAADISSNEYYVNMMIAWFFATALAKQYNSTVLYLENNMLNPWIHNKTISKAVDSYRINSEQKEYLKTLRLRGNK